MQSLTAGEPPHEWFRPVVRTTNLDTGKSSEKASQPHYTEKSARDWLKNYASSVKPSTDPLYAEYASNREKISKMMTRLAQARNNPEMRQKLQAESDKLDARQREVAAQLQKRKSSRPGAKAKFEKEYVLWGLPKGETDAIHQQVLSTQAKTPAQMEDVKKRAAAAGWHSFRVQILDLSKPYKGFARPGVKGKFVRIVTTPQGRYTTNLDKNTRAPIEGGKGYVMVDPAQYITPKRVRVQGTKGEIEVRAVLDGKEIVGVSAKLVSSRPGAKAKMGSSQVNDAATTADLIREAQRLRDVIKTSNREFDKTHLRQIKQELDKRGVLMPYGASEVLASRPGAKAKA
jgi:hypothetical protein